ncbi:MAG: secondary thiamine-phosphate synthase enzyme YjbQ [Actinomycetota bacterium]|nr:secondary thiamine-phosphate synthase enzyme YjbQ [Actinomycetota bacterium]
MRQLTRRAEVRAGARLDVVDVTEDLLGAVEDSGVTTGCAVAFCAHTTAALIVNENEDGALEDLRRRLEQMVPGDVAYEHDDLERRDPEEPHERPNGRSHVAAMIVGGASHAIPVVEGEPALGRWQRLLLLELDEPKPRTLRFHVFGD